MKHLRLELYRARERRWTAVTILFAVLVLAAACGVLVGAGAQMPGVAIPCAVLVCPLWWLRGWALSTAVYWSQRRNQEVLYLDREPTPR